MATKSPDDVRILQINVGRSFSAMAELRACAESGKYDILAIQEPGISHGKLCSMPLRARIYMNWEKAKAAIVVLNEDMVVVGLSQGISEHLVTVQVIHRGRCFTVISQYCQFKDPVSVHMESLQEAAPQWYPSVLYMADVNAKNELWHSYDTDEDGETVGMMLAELRLQVMNMPGQLPTFRGRAGNGTNIDITAARGMMREYLMKWAVDDEMVPSGDHRAIETCLSMSQDIQEEKAITTPKSHLMLPRQTGRK